MKTLFLLSFFWGALAMAEAPQAVVKSTRTDKAIKLEVIPPAQTHLNYDGPWKLEVAGGLPLSENKPTFDLSSFDKAKHEFTLPVTRPLKATEQGQYTLTYFFCAEDNSWCKRAQTKGVF